MIRRVGEVLRLETESCPELVRLTSLSLNLAIEKVPRVELDARLGCRDIECTAGRRVHNMDDLSKRSHLAIKNEVVSIPNSVVVTTQSKNFSALQRTAGIIVHTEVTIGYTSPWRQVEAMLLAAAEPLAEL